MSNKSLVQYVDRVKERINEPKKWTKYANARNKYNEVVPVGSHDAVCWCLNGAMIMEETSKEEFDDLFWVLQSILGMGVSVWNDSCEGYGEVVRLLERTKREIGTRVE